jgi:hypothetical protein
MASSQEKSTQHNVELLPDELLDYIFSFLFAKDLLQVSLVCRRWLAVSDNIWEKKCFQRYIKLTQSDFMRLRRIACEELTKSDSLLLRSYSQYVNTYGSISKLGGQQRNYNSSLQNPNMTTTPFLRPQSNSKTCWKFVYFYKTLLENVVWMQTKEPVRIIDFYEGGQYLENGYHTYHLFPSCLLFDDEVIVTGTAVWETMNDLSTLMVGNRVIKIWSRTSGLLIKKLDGHPEAILDLDWGICLSPHHINSTRTFTTTTSTTIVTKRANIYKYTDDESKNTLKKSGLSQLSHSVRTKYKAIK